MTADLKPISTAEHDPCVKHCDTAAALRFDAGQAEHLAAGFKALSHPVRVQIVDLLSRFGGEVCVCEIERHFDLTQPTISHHLKVLREAGLIDGDQRGMWIYYRVMPGGIEPLRVLLNGLD
jgi:ArsR family transcriptional regulator